MKYNRLDKIIQSRRTVYPKHYINKKISKKIINRIIENANYAPTHKLTQPWFFKIFDEKSKMRLANEMTIMYKKYSGSKSFSDLKSKKILTKFEFSDFIIAICMKRDKDESIPEWEEIAATSMAVQNMWLTCTSYDLGCYWSTPRYSHLLNSFLKLNKGEKCLGFFYIGSFEHKNLKRTKRSNYIDKMEWM